MTEGPEALFVIDGRQRIVEWSSAAATTLDVPEQAALGQPCYEVVRGSDHFGRARCQPNCSAFKALRSGQLTGRCSLVRPSVRDGLRRGLVCELVALPEVSSGAVGILSERPQESHSTLGTQAIQSFRPSPSSAVNIVHDLMMLAALPTFLSPNNLEQSIEQALEWLRQAAKAEAAELFLLEPQGGDMLLSAYLGPFRKAFSQVTRFHPGEGYPGLVLSRGEPILTQNLSNDHRYLRTQVKGKGFHSYVCVPLYGPNGIIGVLNVAARRSDMDVERVQRVLSWASRPISTVLQAGLLQDREVIGSVPIEVLPDGKQNFDGLLRAVLHQMMLTGNATGGVLLLYDRGVQGVARRVTEGEFTGVVCPDIRLGEPRVCPAMVGGHGIALYGPRYQWPASCQQVTAKGAMVYCLPLVAGGERVGIVQLGYAGHGPSPPTKYLATLLGVAEQAAQVIRQAWANLRNQERALARQSEWKQELRTGVPHAQDSFKRPTQGADEAASGPTHPFLEIRCFGSFELYRQGKLVTPDMIQRQGAITLLKILLFHRGRRVPRDLLVEYLWPEADPKAAANRLYVLVHTLRQAVEPSPRKRPWVFIRSDEDHYYFNCDAPYRYDIEEFETCIKLGARLERDGNGVHTIDAYEKAVSLYRGDFLEDEPYAEWCWEERERLREAYLGLLSKLAALHADQGALETSIRYYRQTLTVDPLREQNHQGLMRVFLAAGRRAEAVRQYQMCRDILRRELDVDPLPETEELYLRLTSNVTR